MVLAFGDYRLDIERRELRYGGQCVDLAPKAFDLLTFLVQHRERVVTKDDLLQAVWDGRIVSESALTTRINAVRRAIGDDGETQRFVRTFTRKGVRFVGEVTEFPPDRVTSAPGRGYRLVSSVSRAALPLGEEENSVSGSLAKVRSTSTVAAVASTITALPRLSIVVLPFTNLSGDRRQQYFIDSITNDLTTDLSRIPGGFVIARNTAFTYTTNMDVKIIGHELGVRYVIEGSVRRTRRRVWINVQLIDTETGAHLWAERFDIDQTNLTYVQEEITGRLARTLDLELIAAADRQIDQENETPLDAQALILRGRAFLYRPPSLQNRHAAARLFERALAIDPRSIDAMVYLAMAVTGNLLDGWSYFAAEDRERAEWLLNEIFSRDSNIVKAHFARGMLRRSQGALVEAQIDLQRAVTLDPNFVPAISQLGTVLVFRGQPEVCILHMEKAIRLSPRDPHLGLFLAVLGGCHLLLGRTGLAVDLLQKALAAHPRQWTTYFWLASALSLSGDVDGAKAILSQAEKVKPGVRSLAQYDAQVPWETDPTYRALRQNTFDVGLSRTGILAG